MTLVPALIITRLAFRSWALVIEVSPVAKDDGERVPLKADIWGGGGCGCRVA